jgi:hypothetical protein
MKFTFTSNEKEVEIEGRKYILKLGDVATIGAVEALRNQARIKIEAFEASNAPATEAVTSLCSFIGEQIDALLGAGAYEQIFKDRPLNVLEHTDLIDCLMAEFDAMAVDRRNSILGQHRPPSFIDDPAMFREDPPLLFDEAAMIRNESAMIRRYNEIKGKPALNDLAEEDFQIASPGGH